MLENLGATIQSVRLDKNRVVSQLSRMQRGGTRSSFDMPLVVADMIQITRRCPRIFHSCSKRRGFV